MKIYLHEITEQETKLSYSEKEEWLAKAVSQVDEKPEESPLLNPSSTGTLPSKASPAAATPPPLKRPVEERPVEVSFSLRKIDNVFLVVGEVRTQITLLCSRCATAFSFACKPQFSSLFSQDLTMIGIEPNTPKQNHGFARHAHLPEDPTSSSLNMDITVITSDCIDLGEIVAEQLRLQIPFQPLCNENCKGICSHCGADLNHGRCACSKVAQPNDTHHTPFSVLGNLAFKSQKTLRKPTKQRISEHSESNKTGQDCPVPYRPFPARKAGKDKR